MKTFSQVVLSRIVAMSLDVLHLSPFITLVPSHHCLKNEIYCIHSLLRSLLTCIISQNLGDLTKNFSQHDSDFGQHNFGRNDFHATWPDTECTCNKDWFVLQRSQMIGQNPSKAGYTTNVSFFVKQSQWFSHNSPCHQGIEDRFL